MERDGMTQLLWMMELPNSTKIDLDRLRNNLKSYFPPFLSKNVEIMRIVSIYPIRRQHLFYIALFRQTEIVGRVVLSTLLPHYPTQHHDEDEVTAVVNNEPAE